MPFKTRKKKQAALKNRVAISMDGAVSYTSFAQTKEAEKSREESYARRVDVLDGELNLPGFKREILKIVLLAALIIGFQLALKFSNLPILK